MWVIIMSEKEEPPSPAELSDLENPAATGSDPQPVKNHQPVTKSALLGWILLNVEGKSKNTILTWTGSNGIINPPAGLVGKLHGVKCASVAAHSQRTCMWAVTKVPQLAASAFPLVPYTPNNRSVIAHIAVFLFSLTVPLKAENWPSHLDPRMLGLRLTHGTARRNKDRAKTPPTGSVGGACDCLPFDQSFFWTLTGLGVLGFRDSRRCFP